MSHFTVLVIGDNYEEQLAPFDENKEVAAYREYVSEEQRDYYDEEELTFDETEGKWFRMSTYNPDSKWDWYQVGGRWRGFFKVKDDCLSKDWKLGGSGSFGNDKRFHADRLLKGWVDVEGMRASAEQKAGALWDEINAVIGGLPVAKSWKSVLAEHPDDLDTARMVYGGQPRVEAFREHVSKLGYFMASLEEYEVSREVFVHRARDQALMPYAYVHEGRWCAPGEMGWWGISSDEEEDRVRFAREFNELFDSLPDETKLTLVDCHI